ncbi:hypothetical protein [Bradyrhizobium yuanmingense]|uniref:hypothetical protein n=1 Tax=Bradyrhizobium yuanmingense TaxID=108015 RepID=UPI001CD200D9|nr:hypothetical protein [Bradyrhizobium yuanmingense]
MIGTTCMLLCGFLRVHFAQQTAGAMSAPGLPCALLAFRGTKHPAKLGRNQPRGCEGVSAMRSAVGPHDAALYSLGAGALSVADHAGDKDETLDRSRRFMLEYRFDLAVAPVLEGLLGKQATGSVITITGVAAFLCLYCRLGAGWRPCGIGLHWFSVSCFSLLWQPLILRPQMTGQSARSAAMTTASPRARG